MQAGGDASRFAPGALSRCTAVDPPVFADKVWSRTASLSRAAELGGAGFSDLLSVAAVDDLVSRQGLRTPFLRVAKDGDTVAEARFTRGGGAGATVSDQVADDQLTRLFVGGSTMVLQGLHRTHAPLISFAQALAAELGHPIQVNAYVTPAQSQGFSAHYDVHDVFVLQVSGEKRWVVHEPVHPDPLRSQPWTDRRASVAEAAARTPLLDVVLQPGDAMYLPRGFLHSATALGQVSVHLTLGVQQWTRAHLVEHLVASMTDVAELRASLPMGVDVTDPGSIRADVAATLDAMRAQLDTISQPLDRTSRSVADRLRATASRAGRGEPVGPLRQAEVLAGLDAATPLRWRRGLRAQRVGDTDGDGRPTSTITTSEITVTVNGADPDALDRLLAGAVVRAGELSPDLAAARLLVGQALAVHAP